MIDPLTPRQLWMLKVLGDNGGVMNNALYTAIGRHVTDLDDEDRQFIDEVCGVESVYAWSEGVPLVGLTAAGWAVFRAAKPALAHLMQITELAEIIAANAYRLYQASASPTPSLEAQYRAMNNPQVGDLVLGLTSMIGRVPAVSRLGRLLEVIPGQHWPEYRVRLLTGEEMTWGNEKFIKVFESGV